MNELSGWIEKLAALGRTRKSIMIVIITSNELVVIRQNILFLLYYVNFFLFVQ